MLVVGIVMFWLGLCSCSFIAARVQIRMAAAAQERRFVHLSGHRCPGTLHQWRLQHGSRDRCALQEEVWWSRWASGSEWVRMIITEKWHSNHTHLILRVICCLLLCAEKQPGQCALLRISDRFVYYLVRWPVVFSSHLLCVLLNKLR